MSSSGSDAFQRPPGAGSDGARSAADPVSWLQIDQGWSVVSADGVELGTVAQVAGTKEEDIFDGLAVDVAGAQGARYIGGEQVALIYPGKVTLKLTAGQAAELPRYTEASPQEALRLPPEPLGARLSRWFRRFGRRD